MPLPRDYDAPIPPAPTPPTVVPVAQRAEYWVRPSGDGWIIAYDGDEYGPYKSRHEAMLCAVDGAHRLGEQGRDAMVRLIDSAGRTVAAWKHGEDPYPPVFFLDVA
jgi:hypothetical protein